MNKVPEKLQKRYESLMRRINAFTNEPGQSQNKLAQASGNSAATISAYVRGTYLGNYLNVTESLEAFFELENERKGIQLKNDFVHTRQTEEIRRFIIMAHAYKTISVIIGDSGLSKTTTLKEYSRQSNVYYIKCQPYMRGKVGFLQQIAISLDVKSSGSQIVVYNRIASEFGEKGALIILDDAQTLNGKGIENTTIFEVIRALHDSGIGFVIAGNSRIRDSVTQTDSEELYQQLAARSRILKIDPRIKREDLESIIASIVEGSMAPDQIDYLLKIANEFYGSLHLVTKILIHAVTRSRAKNLAMSVALLKTAAKHFVSQQKPQFRNKQKGALPNVKTKKQETPSGNSQPLDREEGSAQAHVA